MSGTTLRGLIKLNDTLLLGPDPLGNFLSIAVKSIHRKRMPVKEVRGGQTASFALKKVSINTPQLPRTLPLARPWAISSPHGRSARPRLLTSLLYMRKQAQNEVPSSTQMASARVRTRTLACLPASCARWLPLEPESGT